MAAARSSFDLNALIQLIKDADHYHAKFGIDSQEATEKECEKLNKEYKKLKKEKNPVCDVLENTAAEQLSKQYNQKMSSYNWDAFDISNLKFIIGTLLQWVWFSDGYRKRDAIVALYNEFKEKDKLDDFFKLLDFFHQYLSEKRFPQYYVGLAFPYYEQALMLLPDELDVTDKERVNSLLRKIHDRNLERYKEILARTKIIESKVVPYHDGPDVYRFKYLETDVRLKPEEACIVGYDYGKCVLNITALYWLEDLSDEDRKKTNYKAVLDSTRSYFAKILANELRSYEDNFNASEKFSASSKALTSAYNALEQLEWFAYQEILDRTIIDDSKAIFVKDKGKTIATIIKADEGDRLNFTVLELIKKDESALKATRSYFAGIIKKELDQAKSARAKNDPKGFTSSIKLKQAYQALLELEKDLPILEPSPQSTRFAGPTVGPGAG